MDQKCEAVRVVDGTNWEDFYWPQDVRKLDEEVREMLEKLHLMEYEEVFKGEELSLTDIAQLDHAALDYMGISLVKHRTAIIKYTSGKSKYYVALENFLLTFSKQLSSRGDRDWRRGEARWRIITRLQTSLSDPDQHGSQCRVLWKLSGSVRLSPATQQLSSLQTETLCSQQTTSLSVQE